MRVQVLQAVFEFEWIELFMELLLIDTMTIKCSKMIPDTDETLYSCSIQPENVKEGG